MITGASKPQVDQVWIAQEETAQRYEPPFTARHHEGLDAAFGDADVSESVAVIASITRGTAG